MACTDAHLSHGLCPKGADTWCSFNKRDTSGEPYVHKNYLPPNDLEVLNPIYQQLAKHGLLKKCLLGKTHNANESSNNVVWECTPRMFLGLQTLKIATMDVALTRGVSRGHTGMCFPPPHNFSCQACLWLNSPEQPPEVACRRETSFKDMLVHAKLETKSKPTSDPCGHSRCCT